MTLQSAPPKDLKRNHDSGKTTVQSSKKKRKVTSPSSHLVISPKSSEINVAGDTSEETTNIVSPREQDVICGRGNFANYHAGNAYFRNLVQSYKIDYVACDKADKKKYSKMIFDTIRNLKPPGRFLKFDARLNTWFDIGEKKALDKTRQALREGAPEIMKELLPDQEAAEMILDLRKELVFYPDKGPVNTNSMQHNDSSSTVSQENNRTPLVPAMTAREVTQENIANKSNQEIVSKLIPHTRLF